MVCGSRPDWEILEFQALVFSVSPRVCPCVKGFRKAVGKACVALLSARYLGSNSSSSFVSVSQEDHWPMKTTTNTACRSWGVPAFRLKPRPGTSLRKPLCPLKLSRDASQAGLQTAQSSPGRGGVLHSHQSLPSTKSSIVNNKLVCPEIPLVGEQPQIQT